jgi:flagellar hook-associated protein 3 FlgL
MASFRVTQNMLVDRSLTSLQLGLSRLAGVQEQLSTGRVLNRPSDSPTDTATAMRLRTSLGAVEQYSRNADDGIARLGTVDSTLFGVTTQVNRAKTLALQGANSGSISQTARDALATEVDQLRLGLLDDANTTHLSWPIFGGVTAGERAYDDSGAYVGTPGAITRRVEDGVRLNVDVDGRRVFGDGDASVFAELEALSTALRAGDDAGIRAGMDALDARLQTVATVHTEVGATYARLEDAAQSLEDRKLDLTKALSDVENVDLPKAMIDLNLQEVAYQAALASTARVVQPSLLDFLR